MGLGLWYMFGYWDIGVAGIDVSHLVPADEDAIIHRHAGIHYIQFYNKIIQKLFFVFVLIFAGIYGKET